jgi:Carboxypeptidase regulatory-like domain
MKQTIRILSLGMALFLGILSASAQSVTTASIVGKITNKAGEALDDANVIAIHTPSSTRYAVSTDKTGRFTLDGLRVGGPYIVTVSYAGFQAEKKEDLQLSLGQVLRLNFTMGEAILLSGLSIEATKNDILNSQRTGAATNIGEDALSALPTFSRSLNDFTRLTPQSRPSSVATTAGSGTSFAGADSRFNNLTIDGSIFNNSFGLASGPGGQTNASPISLDAIQEVQVNIAPYDVRQGGFVGAGVNAVTRSGSNKWEGSAFYNTRNQSMLGDSISYTLNDTLKTGSPVKVNNFSVNQYGFRLGGPLIKDKVFFFVNAEGENRVDPATLFTANRSSSNPSDPNLTRVSASELDSLRQFLISKYNYDPGAYDGYNLNTKSNKGLAKLDFNINEKTKASIRYNYLFSSRDVLSSNSGVVSGNRNGTKNALNFENTNYVINNNIHSVIGEVNTRISKKMSNQFQAGFTANRDFRSSKGGIFPLVDIMKDGSTYTSFGYEPFTPNNILNTNTFQLQDNLTMYKGNHTLTGGINFEHFTFENTFTPTYYGQFVYNSLADFYAAANGDTSVSLRRYALTYSALPGGALPTAETKVTMPGAYIQDVMTLLDDKLKVTAGLRVDVPIFANTAINNPAVDTLKFADRNDQTVQFSTSQLPGVNPLFSPRIGFNYDVKGDRTLQIRGGTGIFSGRPPFVWLSNQIGNNGVLTGSMRFDNTRNYMFSADVNQYIPANPTLPSSYNLALTEKGFKFPQTWRNNLAVDMQLPMGWVATLEGMYSKTLNNIFYYNANQTKSDSVLPNNGGRSIFAGAGKTGTSQNNALRINDNITDAIVLGNTNEGYNYSLTGKLERQFSKNWYAMIAYNFSETKDMITGGSIAYSSWRDNLTVNGNNRPDLAFSDFDQRHRVVAAGTYRIKWNKNLQTSFSLFYQGFNQGRTSFRVIGDVNGDQLANNDLLFIPTNADEIDFKDIKNTSGAVVYTIQQQKDALNTLITSNEYLNSRRGQFAERNGYVLPWLNQFDLNIQQDFMVKMKGNDQRFQLRLDLYNVGNMINNSWGVADRVIMNAPLTFNSDGKYTYTMINNQLRTSMFDKDASLNSVWQMQMGLRYFFN